jgi:hypothetical protein
MTKILFLFLFFTNAKAASFFPSEAELLNENAHLIQLSSSYFMTTGFYDQQGLISTLPAGNKFSMINSDFKISYGLTKQVEIAVDARLRNIKSIEGINNLSRTGFESGGILLKYAFPASGYFRSAIGASYRQTLFTNIKYDPPQIAPVNEISLGDDGSEYAIGLFSTYFKSTTKYIGNLSYVSPANNLSAEIRYKLEWQYLFTRASVLAGVDGVWSLNQDPYTAINKPQISLGATHLFNSTNRQIIAPYLGLNYSFRKFAMGFIAQTTSKGKSTDSARSFSLNISTGAEGTTAESEKIISFKEYHVDGSVLKVSAQSNFIKIDQGLSSDVEKGMRFDIYQTDYFGGNILVASGIAYEVGADWSNVKLVKKYKNVEIKAGFAARGY